MALATWWQGDHLPILPMLSNLDVVPFEDTHILAAIAQLDVAEIENRLNHGHTAYTAWLDNMPVAYGWVASQSAEIGELGLSFTLPHTQRYLWDFATLAPWRGVGIYPSMLQYILEHESADHFWIIHAPENIASGRGISRAGFTSVGELSFLKTERGVGLMSFGERALFGAKLLKIPLVEIVAPCWGCAMRAAPPACWSSSCECSQRH